MSVFCDSAILFLAKTISLYTYIIQIHSFCEVPCGEVLCARHLCQAVEIELDKNRYCFCLHVADR